MAWLMIRTDSRSLHVIPFEDDVEHEENEDCVCGTTAELQGNGSWLYTHHSLDGRERNE